MVPVPFSSTLPGKGLMGSPWIRKEEELIFSHQDIRMPDRGSTYAINHGNRTHWFSSTEKLVEHFSQNEESTYRPYSQRWVGSMIADFHRILLEGGLYLYPGDRKRPDGKLRLLYECSPLALIARQAGGKTSTGRKDILDIQPTQLHQRVPLIIGSRSCFPPSWPDCSGHRRDPRKSPAADRHTHAARCPPFHSSCD
jgi:fructose-1,6-bisphosphatase I